MDELTEEEEQLVTEVESGQENTNTIAKLKHKASVKWWRWTMSSLRS